MMNKTVNDVMEEYGWESFEERTYKNILIHRKEALMRIYGGEKATRVIPQSNQRRKLRRDKILRFEACQGGRQIFLTDEALRGMRELGFIK